MPRDMELIRIIMIELGKRSSGSRPSPLIIEGYDPDIIEDHLLLLREKNYVRGWQADNCAFMPSALTMDGYDFLENIQNETFWKKLKTESLKRGMPFSLDVILKLIPELISRM